MTIKELFGDGSLSYEEFEKAMKEKGAKFVDLSEGNYVSKDKYENEVASKDSQISQLNETIKLRDKDLKDLKTQLADTSTSEAEKLSELEGKLTQLQAQYKTDTENYKKQLGEQAYGFAVSEFANGKKFSSKAAKRDFVSALKAAQLKMDGNDILGAEDFATKYFSENEDALFVDPTTTQPPVQQTPPTPTFAASTTPDTTPSQHKSLSEMMQLKNENPDAVISFGN